MAGDYINTTKRSIYNWQLLMTTLFMCIYHALFNCLISIKIEIENGLHFINIIAYHCIACHNLLVSQCCATTCWSAHAVLQPAWRRAPKSKRILKIDFSANSNYTLYKGIKVSNDFLCNTVFSAQLLCGNV